eukprot:422484-Amphidinium_carterae.1
MLVKNQLISVTLGVDLVAVQETFFFAKLLEELTSLLSRLGTTLLLPPPGKPVGDQVEASLSFANELSLSAKQAGVHWARVDGGTISYISQTGSTEKNRELCMELFGVVAALGNRKIFILGDWNFEPDEFPIDLIHGGQVNRHLRDVDGTSGAGDLVLHPPTLLPHAAASEDMELWMPTKCLPQHPIQSWLVSVLLNTLLWQLRLLLWLRVCASTYAA